MPFTLGLRLRAGKITRSESSLPCKLFDTLPIEGLEVALGL